MANHLTPSELADEVNMKRREVISKCMEMGVPIFQGKIDKSLFVSSLAQMTDSAKRTQIGSPRVSVVRSAESLLGATRLPIDCSARPVTPPIGAVTLV